MTITDAQNTFNTLKTENARIQFLKDLEMRDCFYSRFLKKNVQSIGNFISHEKLNPSNFKLIKEVIKGTAKRCPYCNSWMLSSNQTCSRKCSGKDIAVKNKERLNKMYGIDNVFQLKEVKDKIRHTNLEKYGVEYSSQRKDWSDIVKRSNLEKYGVEYVSQLQEVRKIISSKLSYNFVHAEDMNLDFIKSHFIKDGKFLNDDFTKYFNITRKTALKYRNVFNIDTPLEYKQSRPQKELFDWIPCSNKVYNDRKVITPNELDIVLPDIKLAIEYNGAFYHSDKFKPKDYHLSKTNQCEEAGYHLFQIFDTDDIDIWKSMISGKLGKNRKIYARKCCVAEISSEQCEKFCAQNHLQGSVGASVRLGLFYYNDDEMQGELVEVMTFGKSRYNKYMQYELLRLCTLKYTNVIGGASKLFKYFVRKYNPTSIISYANRRFSQGNIYNVLGFKFQGYSAPNYFYLVNGNLFSRVKYQKHKLKNVLKIFNPELSEVDNMHNNGFYRVFDCGNIVYTWKSDDNGV